MPEELLDIVDDNDNVVGRETRSVVHERGLQHRGVHVFLFTSHGKLLVHQRNKDRKAYPSSLDCSVSEHVKAGEDYLTAAQRGLREEMGLEGIPLEPIITFRMIYGTNDNEISRIYQGPLADPLRVRFDPVEVDWVDFAGLPELEKLLDNRERPFSYWLEQFILWSAGRPNVLEILDTHGVLRPDAYSK